jgi:chemotaxis protein MotB
MFALFIVLWIMAQSQSVKMSVSQYFKNPGLLTGSTELKDGTPDEGTLTLGTGETAMPSPSISQGENTEKSEAQKADVERAKLQETIKKIEEMMAVAPELKNLKDQVKFFITDEGLRIELIEKENSLFFDVGSAAAKQQFKKLLQVIAQELVKLPNPVTIEGHTDGRPFGSKSYTNWELSTDRANAARRLFDEEGFPSNKLHDIRGYADQRLINPQNPLDFTNRRVSVVVHAQDRKNKPQLNLPITEKKEVSIQPVKKPDAEPLNPPQPMSTPLEPAKLSPPPDKTIQPPAEQPKAAPATPGPVSNPATPTNPLKAVPLPVEPSKTSTLPSSGGILR